MIICFIASFIVGMIGPYLSMIPIVLFGELGGDKSLDAFFRYTAIYGIGSIIITPLSIWATVKLFGKKGSYLNCFTGSLIGASIGITVLYLWTKNIEISFGGGLMIILPSLGGVIGYNRKQK